MDQYYVIIVSGGKWTNQIARKLARGAWIITIVASTQEICLAHTRNKGNKLKHFL